MLIFLWTPLEPIVTVGYSHSRRSQLGLFSSHRIRRTEAGVDMASYKKTAKTLFIFIQLLIETFILGSGKLDGSLFKKSSK